MIRGLFPVLISGMVLGGLAAVGSQPLAAQTGTISGRVVSAETGQALASADVFVVGTVRRSLTDVDGGFSLGMPPGTYTVRARLVGYQAAEQQVSVSAGATATVEFRLQAGAVIMDELVVIGSRTQRSVLETPVPVDVIPAFELREAGHTEVNQILATAAPSFNASYQTIADGSDHINPASLRGLGPDQVLVLVNGKRRHQSALLHVNGTFGRGTVGVDLNAIPPAAIERIEVLRDGASAQYGSDAIAGVINIVLKDQTQHIEANGMAGVSGGYAPMLSTEGRRRDGEQVRTDVNFGFPFGDRGYVNVTGEYFNIERTNRSDPWQGDIFPGISGTAATDAELTRLGLTRDDFSMKTGQGAATGGMIFYNAAAPLGESAEFYSFGGVSHRNGAATGFYRLPNQEARVVPEIHPNGFLPEIHTELQDRSFTAGMRGATAGWDLDLSVTHGGNSLQFNIENSDNGSMGTSSPTTFDAGRLHFTQTTGNFDAVRLLNTGGALRSLSLVLGGEFRVENYRIDAGEDASWQLGNGGSRPGIDFDTTASGAPKEPGSQVFPGFQPSNEVDRFRNSISAYAGLEIQATDKFLVDVGGRFENYEDFGNRLTGKVATRLEVSPEFAIRGALSTGFRAPSLHQIWFNNVSIQFLLVGGSLEPVRVLTSNNQSRVTKAFGIPDLKEETSVNVSAGFTARPLNNLSLTADFYHVRIDDRIVLTSRFDNADPIVAGILQPFARDGVGAAQFFANAVDTRTNGVDIVAAYETSAGPGTLTLQGAANLTDTEVLRINIPQAVADTFAGGDLNAVANTIFNREERNRLEDALPRVKGSFSARYAVDRFTFKARGTYYGSIEYKPSAAADDETFGAKTLFDLDVGYELRQGVRVSVGGTNILNTFPDRHLKPSNYSNGRFPFSRRVTQFGMNGGFYYARLQLTL